MIEVKNFEPREYQKSILGTAIKKNTLVVLPTGLGKSFISLLLGINRLNETPNSKILICSPTKPLSNQLYKIFKNYTTINPEEICLLTGAVNPSKRSKIWKNSTVIAATPQTIQSDLKNKRLSLSNVSLLTIDEAHHSKMRYANTYIAKKYIDEATNPRILALTASPGGTKQKIEEICKNLFIEAVEIRTENDGDVTPYIQERKIEWINVKLPEEFLKLHQKINIVYKEKLKQLKNFGLNKPLSIINKKDLILFQNYFRRILEKGDNTAYSGISLTAQALKLNYILELIETQGLKSAKEFLEKLKYENTKAAKHIVNRKEIIEAKLLIDKLVENNIRHPKMEKLSLIVQDQLRNNKDSKIIVFANFRNTVKEIVLELKNIQGAKPIELMGQKEGITQKQQIETIKNFEDGIYNILVGTSISEEGLDISGAVTAIFYEPISSEIRKIQRMGRVARTQKGNIIFLITEDTRDEGYYWASKRKEKIMTNTLQNMQKKNFSKGGRNFS